MRKRLQAMAILLTILFFERFPEEDDQSNPYMFIRLLKPLIKDTKWEAEVRGKGILITHPWNY